MTSSAGHNLRRLIEAVETNDIIAAEQEAKTLALTLLTDPSDARNSFVQNEGFLLTQVHWKLLLNQLEDTKNQQNSNNNNNNNNNTNRSKLISLLASLMPGGLSKILQGNTPVAVSGGATESTESPLANMIRDFRANHLPVLMNKINPLSFLAQHHVQDIANVATKVQKWSAADYSAKYNGSTIGATIVESCNTLAEVFSASSSSSFIDSISNNNSMQYLGALQFLIFLVAGRAECCSCYVKEIAAPKRLFFQSVFQFESARGLIGTFSPFIRFATSVWFTSLRNGVLMPKETTSKCFEILFAKEEEEENNKNTVSKPNDAGSRREREEGDCEENEEETSFAEKIKDRIKNLPSVCENGRENAEIGFSSIAQEIEFSSQDGTTAGGVSDTAREVDRLIPFLRNAFFSVAPFDKKNCSVVAAVAFDRRRSSAATAETRCVLPNSASMDGGMTTNANDDAASSQQARTKTGLERIALNNN